MRARHRESSGFGQILCNSNHLESSYNFVKPPGGGTCYDTDMPTPCERILLVENDPAAGQAIRQTLDSLGYPLAAVRSAAEAIQESAQAPPDVILADLALPDLSGKDLLVALLSQGIEAPVIVIAERGMDSDVIQAFRLGAVDFLCRPIREAELLTVVERTVRRLRAQREREQLADQLKRANRELQRRVRELAALLSFGRSLCRLGGRSALWERLVEGAVYLTRADRGWLLIREGSSEVFRLGAQRNLPAEEAARLNQPWEDGISSLAARSAKALLVHGEALGRPAAAELGRAWLVAPVKAEGQVPGLLVVVRKECRPFTPGDQGVLEAVADFAAVSFRTMGE